MTGKRYVVITTPTCTRCKVLKKLVEEQGLGDKIEFVASFSDRGTLLMRAYKIRGAGMIMDTQTNTIVELADVEV